MMSSLYQCCTPSMLLGHSIGRRRLHHARVRCCKVARVNWNGDEPVPYKLPSSCVSLHKPCQSIDGLALFRLCQSLPDLKELEVSAASFNSPVQGQWDLRNLRKLHVKFDGLSHDEGSVDQFLQHAEGLYLEELQLSHMGPGFAGLNAASLAHLHVDKLELEGFDICNSGKLAHRRGRLHNCVLDVSQIDFFFLCAFNNTAPQLLLERCRLPAQTFSWRILTFLCTVAGLLALLIACAIAYPVTTMLVGGLGSAALLIFDITLFRNMSHGPATSASNTA